MSKMVEVIITAVASLVIGGGIVTHTNTDSSSRYQRVVPELRTDLSPRLHVPPPSPINPPVEIQKVTKTQARQSTSALVLIQVLAAARG